MGGVWTAVALGWGAALVFGVTSVAQTPTTKPGFVVVPAEVFKDPNGEKPGLLLGIFDGQDFMNQLVNKITPMVDLAAKDGDPPDPDYPSNNDYGVRWRGNILPPVSGDYTLEIQSTGGAALYVGDATVIDALTEKGPQDRRGVVKLEAGKLVAVEVDFLQVKGPARCDLLWKPPSDGATSKP